MAAVFANEKPFSSFPPFQEIVVVVVIVFN
jgi:hypothetical protein